MTVLKLKMKAISNGELLIGMALKMDGSIVLHLILVNMIGSYKQNYI